jgi:hypothetical protein
VNKNASLARKVALSCRILAKLGLFKETTGHVSARNGKYRMLIRGRGPRETGLLCGWGLNCFSRPRDKSGRVRASEPYSIVIGPETVTLLMSRRSC